MHDRLRLLANICRNAAVQIGDGIREGCTIPGRRSISSTPLVSQPVGAVEKGRLALLARCVPGVTNRESGNDGRAEWGWPSRGL
jgi:hypothetical protein